MGKAWMTPRKAMSGMVLAGLAAGLVPTQAAAQDDSRLRKLEAEIRALQRAVFPGGDSRYFEPEVDTSRAQPQQPPVGTPSSTALTDVLARLEAIEAQLARLTARSEENANAIMQLNEEMEMMKNSSGSSIPSGSPLPPSGATSSGSRPSGVIPVPEQGGGELPAVAQGGSQPANAPAQAGPSPERVAAVKAIAKPSSGDAGEDEYVYGFRLWDAKFYPEAEQQLALFLEKYPDHWRASYGRNLLGRAYMDDGKPREAARYFLDNYQADKSGARAPDSLLYLAEAMTALGDTSRACIALAEFGDTYPALATGRLQKEYENNRARVDCN
ncbi:TolA-binding protein [Altererythrobacter atlanticus]|nr:TolA-binding protein [Croceibacterium atlanticum]